MILIFFLNHGTQGQIGANITRYIRHIEVIERNISIQFQIIYIKSLEAAQRSGLKCRFPKAMVCQIFILFSITYAMRLTLSFYPHLIMPQF